MKLGQLVAKADAVPEFPDIVSDPKLKLAHTVFVVGDVGQTLYSFAQAHPEILSSEIKAIIPDINTVKLKINYRSTGTIIGMAQRLIAHNYSDLGGPFDQEVYLDVSPRPEAGDGEPISWKLYQTPEAEAEGVAATIVEGMANGWTPGDVFIGARTRAQLAHIEAALAEVSIPYINLCGGSFWLQKHVNMVVQYLTLAWCENELEQAAEEQTRKDLLFTSSEAFEKVYNIATQWNIHRWGERKGEYCPHRYLGQKFLEYCIEDGLGVPLYKNIHTARNKRRSYEPGVDDLVTFVQDILISMHALEEAAEWEEIEGQPSSRDVSHVIKFITDNCILPWLRHEEGLNDTNDGSGSDKLDDLATVMAVAKDFKTVGEFLGHVQKLVEAAEASKNGDWSKHVIIATIHRLKGLERRFVFGIGWCEGINPVTNDPVGLLPHTFALRPPPNDSVLPSGSKSEIWEERCIAYVLITRAKTLVFLSAPKTYRDYLMHPSRFLFEMGLIGEEDESENASNDSTVEGDFSGAGELGSNNS